MSDDRVFNTGAIRGNNTGKGRFDLISPEGERRLALRYEHGSVRYGDRSWEQGIPASSCIDSAKRHINQWLSGDDSEDHLSAAAWNLFAIMDYEANNRKMIDLPKRKKNSTRW